MGLAEAVLDVVTRMEEWATPDDDQHSHEVRGFARELRTAVKASEGMLTRPQNPFEALERKAKEDRMRKELKAKADREEGNTPKSVEIVGGPYDDTWTEVNGSMPVGAYMFVGELRHQLRGDGKLHYAHETKSVG